MCVCVYECVCVCVSVCVCGGGVNGETVGEIEVNKFKI